MFISGLGSRAAEAFSELRKTGRVSTAVFTDTIGVGLIAPISLLYFTLTTDISIGSLGVALTLATLASLPIGLLGGWVVDRFGVKAAMVSNNLVSGIGFILYLFAQEPIGVFFALFVVASSERVYWASWSSYVESLSDGRPFERWFAFLEAVKAGAMGIGALVGAVILAPGGILAANVVVILNVATCFFSAVLFATQPIVQSKPSADALEEPELLGALRGFTEVVRDPKSLSVAAGALLLSPIMLLPNAAISIVLVQQWQMPASVASVLFALNLGVVALLQTTITHMIRYRSRSGVIWISAGLIVVVVAPLTFLNDPSVPVAWTYVVVAGLILGFVDTLYLPATNALMVQIPPEARRGRSVAVSQTAAAIGMALFPLLLVLLSGQFAWVMWVVTATAVVCGAAFYSLSVRGADRNIRFPEAEADRVGATS